VDRLTAYVRSDLARAVRVEAANSSRTVSAVVAQALEQSVGAVAR